MSLTRPSSFSGSSKLKRNLLADTYDIDKDRSTQRESDPNHSRRSLTKSSASKSRTGLFVQDIVIVLDDMPHKCNPRMK
jgi:hypothetical protein